jgi:hypothetical protein
MRKRLPFSLLVLGEAAVLPTSFKSSIPGMPATMGRTMIREVASPANSMLKGPKQSPSKRNQVFEPDEELDPTLLITFARTHSFGVQQSSAAYL